MNSPFCGSCGAKLEWHVTKSGANMPINPAPVPGGRYVFNNRMRLEYVGAGKADPGQKRYDSHQDTCPKKKQAPRRAAFVCDEPGCDIEANHVHCYRCRAAGHYATNCTEAA